MLDESQVSLSFFHALDESPSPPFGFHSKTQYKSLEKSLHQSIADPNPIQTWNVLSESNDFLSCIRMEYSSLLSFLDRYKILYNEVGNETKSVSYFFLHSAPDSQESDKYDACFLYWQPDAH